MSSQTLPLTREDHQPFIVAIMEAQRRPREEEQRGPGRLASILDSIPSIPRFNLPSKSPQKQRSDSTAFKMTKISKTAIVPKTGHDLPQQNWVNGFRSKGKQRSLLSNESSTAGHSRADRNQIQSNGHTPTTSQRIEPIAVEHSSHSGEASISVNNSCVSTLPAVPAPVDTATAGPPVVEETPRKHVKKMAHDCYVDLAQPLSPELERAWDNKIHPWLDTNLLHSMEDPNYISAELVMAGIKHDGSIFPTILVMCRDLAQKESIEEMLKRCTFIPKNVQRRILIFDILKCTSKAFIASPSSERLLGRMFLRRLFLGKQITIDAGYTHDAFVLYANVARVYPATSERLFVLCTIGGVLSVNGKLFGLTTAHPFAASGDEGQTTPFETSGMRACVLL